MFRDSHWRSLTKGLTWRILATMTTVIIAWFVVGDVQIAFEIGAIEVVAKIAIYYVHERTWELVPRQKSPLTTVGTAPGCESG